MNLDLSLERLQTLEAIQQHVLWLSALMIHHANYGKTDLKWVATKSHWPRWFLLLKNPG